jgi:hypothetical protein
MKPALAAILTTLALSLPALSWAQTPVEPSPERVALAGQLLAAQGGSAAMIASLNAVQKSMYDALGQSGNLTPEARKAMFEALDKTFTALIPKLQARVAGVYAADFDEKQLKDILAFYRSPTGEALVAKLPDIARQSSYEMGKYMPQIQVAMLEGLCSQTACPKPVLDRIDALKQSIPPGQAF